MGKFDTHGGYFAPQDYFRIDKGGSHEENPNGGVQVGVDPQGTPNLLEENEPVYKDFVYSDNIAADAKMLKKHNIPAKYAGKLYSEIADAFVDEAGERPNDPISNNGLNAMLVRLADSQEEQKQIQQKNDLEKELASLSPEELAELEQILAQQQNPEMQEGVQQQEMPMAQPQIQDTMMQEAPVMAMGGNLYFPGGPLSSQEQQEANAWVESVRSGAVGLAGVPRKYQTYVQAETANPVRNAVYQGQQSAIEGSANFMSDYVTPLMYLSGVGTPLALGIDAVSATTGHEPSAAARGLGLAAMTPVRGASRFLASGAASALRGAGSGTSSVLRGIGHGLAGAGRGTLKFLDNQFWGNATRKMMREEGKATLNKAQKAYASTQKTTAKAQAAYQEAKAAAKTATSAAEKKAAEASVEAARKARDVADAKNIKAFGKTVGAWMGNAAKQVGSWVPGLTLYNRAGYEAALKAKEATLKAAKEALKKAPKSKKAQEAVATATSDLDKLQRWSTKAFNYGTWELPAATAAAGAAIVGGSTVDNKAKNRAESYNDYANGGNLYADGSGLDFPQFDDEPEVSPMTGATGYGNRFYTNPYEVVNYPWDMVDRYFGGDVISPYFPGATIDYTGPQFIPFDLSRLSDTSNARVASAANGSPSASSSGAASPQPDGAAAAAAAAAEREIIGAEQDDVPEEEDQEDDTEKAAVGEDTTGYRAPLSTGLQYAGPAISGLLAAYNAAQPEDKYNIRHYSPVVPRGQMGFINPTFVPEDRNLLTNQVLAESAGTARALRNSGIGAALPQTLLALDANTGRLLGDATAKVMQANTQARNATIDARNRLAELSGNFDYNKSLQGANILNQAQNQNISNELMQQRLNYMSEGQKYAAIQQQLDAVADALSKMGRQNVVLNQIAGDRAYDYVPGLNGWNAYAPLFRRFTDKQGAEE